MYFTDVFYIKFCFVFVCFFVYSRMTWPTLVSHPFWEGLLDNIAQEFVTPSAESPTPCDSKLSASIHSLNSSCNLSLASDSSKCQENVPISSLLPSDQPGFDTRDSVRISKEFALSY